MVSNHSLLTLPSAGYVAIFSINETIRTSTGLESMTKECAALIVTPRT